MDNSASAYEEPQKDFVITMQLVESDTHRAGWNRYPGVLYRVFIEDMGLEGLPENYQSVTHLSVSGIHLNDRKSSIPSQLRTLALTFESPLAPLLLASLAREDGSTKSPPVGRILICEMLVHDNDPEFNDLSSRGLNLWDMPGSQMARVVFGITGESRLLYQRVKGKTPEFIEVTNQPAFDKSNHPFALLSRIHRADLRAWRTAFGDPS